MVFCPEKVRRRGGRAVWLETDTSMCSALISKLKCLNSMGGIQGPLDSAGAKKQRPGRGTGQVLQLADK